VAARILFVPAPRFSGCRAFCRRLRFGSRAAWRRLGL